MNTKDLKAIYKIHQTKTIKKHFFTVEWNVLMQFSYINSS